MASIELKIFHGYTEDHRASMDLYADNLAEGFRKLFSTEFNVTEFRPTVPRYLQMIPEKCALRMQLARYLSYSLQARKEDFSVAHVTQPGYAHILGRQLLSRSIVTVHDLIPFLVWKGEIQGIHKTKRPLLGEYSLSYLKYAHKIIVISENTKKDVMKHLRIPEEKIKVIYFGIDDEFLRDPVLNKRELRRDLGLPGEGTKILLITGRETHKNHITCLRVMSILEKKYSLPIRMVKLGENYSEWDDYIKSTSLENKVISFEKHLDISRVADLYDCSDLLLFPSLYEGFGLPPIEAMARGVPVVCSNAASLPEAVGLAALMTEPDDVEGLADRVIGILENDDLRASMVEKGFRNVSRFSWKKNVEETAVLYREISKKSENRRSLMKVLFIYPDYAITNFRQFQRGVALVSAGLKRSGVQTGLLHVYYEPKKEKFLEDIRAFDPDIIAYSSISRPVPDDRTSGRLEPGAEHLYHLWRDPSYYRTGRMYRYPGN